MLNTPLYMIINFLFACVVYDVRGVALLGFQSYFSERLHYVSINDKNSDYLFVESCAGSARLTKAMQTALGRDKVAPARTIFTRTSRTCWTTERTRGSRRQRTGKSSVVTMRRIVGRSVRRRRSITNGAWNVLRG